MIVGAIHRVHDPISRFATTSMMQHAYSTDVLWASGFGNVLRRTKVVDGDVCVRSDSFSAEVDGNPRQLHRAVEWSVVGDRLAENITLSLCMLTRLGPDSG